MHPPARHSSRLGQRLQGALGAAAALAAISLSPGSAQAYVVTVGGTQYDVTTFTGTYNDNISKFATAANGGVMPWWGNGTSTISFATAVGNYFGPNTYYAYNDRGAGWPNPAARFNVILWQGSGYTGSGVGANSSLKYATASEVRAPGPLPLFGAAAAFGFSRKPRKRIKLAPGALASSQPLA
jgi:hypothetical protein